MPAVKNVGEPCAGEPHARFDVAAGGNQRQSAMPCGVGASRRPYTKAELHLTDDLPDEGLTVVVAVSRLNASITAPQSAFFRRK